MNHRTGVGDEDLRTARRRRLLDAMADVELDALVLGRRDAVVYATGARALWTAGTRPFGAACVVTGATGAVHLLSTWDAGVPPEVPFEHLYGVTWNPKVMGAALAAVPGLADARRLGTDALSPGFARAVARFAPGADLIPADDVVARARVRKLPGEVALLSAAASVASEALDTAVEAVEAGAGTSESRAAALARLGDGGHTMPTTGVDVRAAADATVVGVGVLVAGYEGLATRTVPEDLPAARAARSIHERLTVACRPGASGADLDAVARSAGAGRWRVRGSGMGFEPPVISATGGHRERLEAGMVLAVEVAVDGALVAGQLHVTADGPERF